MKKLICIGCRKDAPVVHSCFFIFAAVVVLLLAGVTAPVRAEVLPISLQTTAQSFGVGYGAQELGIGDYNGDGNPDLAVPNSDSGTVAVLLSNGDGTFSPVVGGNVPVGPNVVNRCYGVSVADFNGDGNSDVAVPNLSMRAISVQLGLGDGTFDTVVNYAVDFDPMDIALGDFNSDGKLDLAVAGSDGMGVVEILPGNGDGTFNPSINFFRPGNEARSGAVGDFNSDGKLDLAVANGSGVFVVLDVDNAVSQRLAVYNTGSSHDIAMGDFNNDSKLDMAVTDPFNNRVAVLLGMGDGSFGAAVYYGVGTNPIDVATGDFNADGKYDLAVTNQNSNNISLLLGMGDGTFDAAVNYNVGAAGNAIFDVATGDFNKDGKLDMAVTSGIPDFICNIDVLLNTTHIVTGLNLTGSIPDLMAGGNVFDLSNLPLTAQNQLGQPVNITDMPATWACSGTTGSILNAHYLEPLFIGQDGTVTITVDGVTSNDLGFNVLPNAHLGSLSLSTGDISFSPSNTSYTQTVTAGIGSVTITASTDDPHASVNLNGSPLPAGDPRAIDLAYGLNNIEIEVVAQDASTKTYTINITREYPLIAWATGNLEASNVNTADLTLTWPPAISDAGISCYRLYQDGTLLSTVSGLVYSCKAIGLNAGTAYTFSVFAVDTGENVSNELTLTTSTLSSILPEIPEMPASGGGNDSTASSKPVSSNNGSVTVDPLAGGTVSLGDDVSLKIPAYALHGSGSAQVDVQTVNTNPSIPAGFMLLGKVYEFTVNKQAHYSFNQLVTLTFTFDPSQLGQDETPLVHYYDETQGEWVNIGGAVSGSTITVNVDHFTQYAIIVEKVVHPPAQRPALIFTDTAGHWAEANINELITMGTVSGYTDGTFKPESTITRAEFAAMLVKAIKLKQQGGHLFNDTSSHWAEDFISTAVSCGIVSGYDKSCFGPDDNLTREQMAVMVVKAIKLNQAYGEFVFIDNKDISAWAKDPVTAAVKNQIMMGYPNNSFRPRGNATRAEAVTVIIKALQVYNKEI
ncbi:MAG: FG-GAP-like repeat-containing protein [Deltaproteobacteria bacterium]